MESTESKNESLLARLKPFEPRRGNVLKVFVYRGIKFDVERGWYRVEPDVAAHLRDVRQRASDPQSPLAFDVLSEEEARALDVEQLKDKDQRRTAKELIELSSARPVASVEAEERPPAPEHTAVPNPGSRTGSKRERG